VFLVVGLLLVARMGRSGGSTRGGTLDELTQRLFGRGRGPDPDTVEATA
jgi:hypothetical protein